MRLFYAALPLCAVQLCRPPPPLLLSVSDNAKETAHRHTHHYTLRIFRLLSHYYIIPLNSQRPFIHGGAFITHTSHTRLYM